MQLLQSKENVLVASFA